MFEAVQARRVLRGETGSLDGAVVRGVERGIAAAAVVMGGSGMIYEVEVAEGGTLLGMDGAGVVVVRHIDSAVVEGTVGLCLFCRGLGRMALGEEEEVPDRWATPVACSRSRGRT